MIKGYDSNEIDQQPAVQVVDENGPSIVDYLKVWCFECWYTVNEEIDGEKDVESDAENIVPLVLIIQWEGQIQWCRKAWYQQDHSHADIPYCLQGTVRIDHKKLLYYHRLGLLQAKDDHIIDAIVCSTLFQIIRIFIRYRNQVVAAVWVLFLFSLLDGTLLSTFKFFLRILCFTVLLMEVLFHHLHFA